MRAGTRGGARGALRRKTHFRRETGAGTRAWGCGLEVGPRGGPGLEVRMYSRDDVELALYALEEGMGARGAAELVGCGVTAVLLSTTRIAFAQIARDGLLASTA